MKTIRTSTLLFIGLLCIHADFSQKKADKDILVSFTDTANRGYGYKNLYGGKIYSSSASLRNYGDK